MELARNLSLLVGRVVVGAVFVLHGLLKVANLNAAVAGFAALGIPLPGPSLWFAFLVEIIGGLALMLGVGTRVASVLLAAVALGALVFAHLPKGFFAGEGGFEYVMVLAAVTPALGFTPGDFSLDRTFAKKKAASGTRRA